MRKGNAKTRGEAKKKQKISFSAARTLNTKPSFDREEERGISKMVP